MLACLVLVRQFEFVSLVLFLFDEIYAFARQIALHCLSKLAKLPIGVQHLQETGIGRTVNGMRKTDGAVGEKARSLVNKWKLMVQAEDDKSESGDEDVQYEELEPLAASEDEAIDRHRSPKKHKVSNQSDPELRKTRQIITLRSQ